MAGEDKGSAGTKEVQQHITWLLEAGEGPSPTGDYLTDPKVRPPFDYATLCAKAIMSCTDGQGTLTDLYTFISGNYPYYAQSWACWQNSIRHTLSHHKCFVRVEGPSRAGRNKNCRYWTIATDQRHLFTDEGVYIATNSRKRQRNVKDVSGQFNKKGKARKAYADLPPKNLSMPPLPANASPELTQSNPLGPVLFDRRTSNTVFPWTATDQGQFLELSLTEQTTTPQALSPASDTPSPLLSSESGIDVGDMCGLFSLGLCGFPSLNSLNEDTGALLLEDCLSLPSFANVTADIDWNAVANILGLEA